MLTQFLTRKRAYPEKNNFETFVPRNLKFYTLGDLAEDVPRGGGGGGEERLQMNNFLILHPTGLL